MLSTPRYIAHFAHIALAAGLAISSASAAASATDWFRVSGAGDGVEPTVVEINMDTVRLQTGRGEGVIRVTLNAPRKHPAGFMYRSFVASAQFDCPQRSIQLTSAAYFAQPYGQGARERAESTASDVATFPQLLENVPVAARQALLRATCATALGNERG